MKTILVTGPTGFIGQRFVVYNQERYRLIPVSVRLENVHSVDFKHVDAVLHLAGMAHSMIEIDPNIYFSSNTELTEQLALAAKKAGVPHFIFMSTVNVYLTETADVVINENTIRTPQTPYGKSKMLAEDIVLGLQSDEFKVAIVRPPLVYGPGVKGNLLRFLQLAEKPWPLPFGKANNMRSMVFLDNLIELTNAIIDQQAVGVFLATDNEPISTKRLITEIRKKMDKQALLFAFPSWVLYLLEKLKPTVIKRLFGSFVIDNSQTKKQLGFIAPYAVEKGLENMTEWFIQNKNNERKTN